MELYNIIVHIVKLLYYMTIIKTCCIKKKGMIYCQGWGNMYA